MKLRKSVSLILVLVLCLLTGCGPVSGDKEITYSAVNSKNDEFTVTIPSTWKSLPGELNDNGDLELSNEKSTHFILGMVISGEDYSGTLEEYKETAAENIGGTYNLTLEEPDSTEVAGYPAYRFEFETKVDNLNVFFRVYVLRTENYFADLYTWSVASLKEEEKDVILGILNSLEEADLPESRTLGSDDGTIGFTAVPKGWYQMHDAETGSDELYLSSMRQDAMVYATSLTKQGLDDGFDFFDRVMMESMEDTYDTELASTRQEKTLPSGTARIYEFEAQEDDTIICYWLYNVETENRFSTLLAAVEKEKLDDFKTELEALLESFAEL